LYELLGLQEMYGGFGAMSGEDSSADPHDGLIRVSNMEHAGTVNNRQISTWVAVRRQSAWVLRFWRAGWAPGE